MAGVRDKFKGEDDEGACRIVLPRLYTPRGVRLGLVRRQRVCECTVRRVRLRCALTACWYHAATHVSALL